MKKKRIGFIGLGKMGKPMAENIFKKGFPLSVYDLIVKPVNELVGLGAIGARSPKELGQNSEIVMLMVPDSPDIEKTVFGKNGTLGGMQQGSIIVVMSTVDPLYVQHLGKKCTKKGVRVIDCPVSGNVTSAKEATLTLMAGGSREVLEECREALGAMGKNIVHCGDVLGSGAMMNVANNLVGLSESLLLHECHVLAVKFGIKTETLYEVFKTSSVSSWMFHNSWAPKVLKGDFTPAFDLDMALKDAGLACTSGKALKVPLLIGSMVQHRLQMESAAGRGKLDLNAAIMFLEELAGVKVRGESK